MSWANLYLLCFVVGLALSLLSLLGGMHRFHLPARWHLPRAGAHAAPTPHGHLGMARAAGRGLERAPYFNFSAVMAFLAWFGGTGYLLTRYSILWIALTLGVATASGLVAAAIVSLFLIKVLLARDAALDPADFDPVGVLGNLSVGIRPGGTGEIIFLQGGSRRGMGARSEDGGAIARGTEVVVTRCEKGIAYVRSWAEMAGELPDRGRSEEAKGAN